MGGRPKPTKLKIVTGNPGNRPINKHEAKIPPGIPDPPAFLSPCALEEWHRIAVPLYNLGILTKYDRATLVMYCQSWGRVEEAETIVQREGLTVKTKQGTFVQHPAVGVANTAGRNCIKYAIELGLTPSARSKISTQGLNARAAERAEEDEFEEYFG